MSRPRVHLLYSDDRVKDRTDGVFHSMMSQLAQDDEEDHNTQLLKRALKYRQKEVPEPKEPKNTEVASCFGVKWHKNKRGRLHFSFPRELRTPMPTLPSLRRINLGYSDELVKTRTDKVFRCMLQQLSHNDDEDHNTRLLKKALQYRKRPQLFGVAALEATEAASCFGVRWQKTC
ncbi:hypothetical protein ACHHYP_12329 [Achlya hypogyna]|uniref:Uncharacterized protein n=1 Tax=Achlya hypogyna TaxID=1202772 RepID=A0A1V9ZGZ9_ACHHY|nr:hypothetical protein ACHHYP_12329 [Achlya hypogyna]